MTRYRLLTWAIAASLLMTPGAEVLGMEDETTVAYEPYEEAAPAADGDDSAPVEEEVPAEEEVPVEEEVPAEG